MYAHATLNRLDLDWPFSFVPSDLPLFLLERRRRAGRRVASPLCHHTYLPRYLAYLPWYAARQRTERMRMCMRVRVHRREVAETVVHAGEAHLKQ